MTEGLPATKEQPSALDGFERAKPGEPIFTLQGGDPLAVEITKLYIQRRRQRALDMDENSRERKAELIRCTEAERTLWAMQEYLRSGKVDEGEPDDRPDEPEAIDLFDYRVRAADRLSGMRCELVEIADELERRGFDPGIRPHFFAESEQLHFLKDWLEPRRLLKTA